MLTGKCHVDSFVYSGLSIDGFQTFYSSLSVKYEQYMDQNMQNHSNLFKSKGKCFLTHSN